MAALIFANVDQKNSLFRLISESESESFICHKKSCKMNEYTMKILTSKKKEKDRKGYKNSYEN